MAGLQTTQQSLEEELQYNIYGILIQSGDSLILDGSNTFAWNKAHEGGGINVQNSSLSSRGHFSFTNNLANQGGGACT